MRHRFLDLAWFLAAALAAGGTARALDNLLPNGDFDNSVGIADWDALSTEMTLLPNLGNDADSCPGSTSMRITNTGTTDGHVTLSQSCATSVALDTTYVAQAEVEFIGSVSDSVALDIDYFASSDCSGAPLAHYPESQVSSGPSGWIQLETTALPAPGATQSMAVRVRFIKDYASDAQAGVSVDRVRLAPVGFIFAEDFEIGSTCRWSATNP